MHSTSQQWIPPLHWGQACDFTRPLWCNCCSCDTSRRILSPFLLFNCKFHVTEPIINAARSGSDIVAIPHVASTYTVGTQLWRCRRPTRTKVSRTSFTLRQSTEHPLRQRASTVTKDGLQLSPRPASLGIRLLAQVGDSAHRCTWSH